MECQICGKQIKQSNYANAILCSSECFNKLFWLTKLDNIAKDKNYADRIVIYPSNNKLYCYYIEDEFEKSQMRGHGGRKFKIKFTNGKTIYSTNLWSNGVIPEDLRDKFKVNTISLEEVK